MDKNKVNSKDPHATLTSNKSFQYLKDLSFRLCNNTKVRIVTLITIIVFTITATWTLSEITRVVDLQSNIQESKYKLEQLSNLNAELSNENASLSTAYSQIKKTEKIPVLISPVDRRAITGRHVTFRWKYSTDPGFQNLVLELVKIDKEGIKQRRFQIPEPGREHMFFKFPLGVKGDFFWRVGTGELLNDQEGTRLWSRFGSFSLYSSVIDKIKSTNEIIVGTTAKFLSYDHPINCEGIPISYDFDFIQWVGKKLKNELKMKDNINVRLKYFKWGNNLFEAIIRGDADVAIANITRSKKREEKYQGLRFTTGYRDNKQIIISKRNNNQNTSHLINDPDKMKIIFKGKTIAAQKQSINLDAANALSTKLAFQVIGGYSSYADVIDAVHTGKIDFGIIDSVRWESVDYSALEKINVDIDALLRDFYKNELGFDHEQYAIALSEKLNNLDFITLLNNIITSEEGKEERKRLNKIHKYESITQRKTDLFQCRN